MRSSPIRGADGDWHVGRDVDRGPRRGRARCRAAARRRRSRGRSTCPPATGRRTLQTTWVEPGYLEPDASWCAPGGEPATPLANGGAFGGKVDSRGRRRRPPPRRRARPAGAGRCYTREDVVRLGPEAPADRRRHPADGTGVVRVARTPGIAAAIAAVAPGLVVEEVDVAGPPTSARCGPPAGPRRRCCWPRSATVRHASPSPDGGRRPRRPSTTPASTSRVRCGDPLDEVVLRSYCTGAAHMALGWVRSEALAVDADGVPVDLTIRSFGILRRQRRPADQRRRSSPTTARRSTAATPCSPPSPPRPGAPPATRRAGRRATRFRPMSKPLGPYSPFVRAGDFIIVSGQGGMKDGAIVEGGVTAQTAQTMANVADHLAEAGADAARRRQDAVLPHRHGHVRRVQRGLRRRVRRPPPGPLDRRGVGAARRHGRRGRGLGVQAASDARRRQDPLRLGESSPQYVAYHDTEWGVPERDPRGCSSS